MKRRAAAPGPPGLTRRQLFGRLAAGALASAAASGVDFLWPRAHQARAIGRPTRIDVAYLSLAGAEPNPRPGVIETLLLELSRNTSVEVELSVESLAPTDPRLFRHPMAFLLGTRELPPIPDAERARLEMWLRSGGLLFIDDCSGLESSPFDRSVRRELARIFPHQPLERISDRHVLYRTFFLLKQIGGRVALERSLEGIHLSEEMTPVVYSRNDLTGAFARDPLGGYLFECIPGGELQRRNGYRTGINLMMYALCLNYKHDLTHVRALLEKRRGVYDILDE